MYTGIVEKTEPGDGSRNGADLFAMLRRSYVLRMAQFEGGARCDKSREQEASTEVAWDRLMWNELVGRAF